MDTPEFKSWNVNDLAVSLSAVPLDAGGYGEDEFLSIDWDEDWWSKYKGGDGSITRSRTNQFGGTATLTYAQTANANDRLSAILTADIANPNGAAAGVFKAVDTEGRLVVLAERAWVMGPPQLKLGKTVQVFAWKIDFAFARTSVFGGR